MNIQQKLPPISRLDHLPEPQNKGVDSLKHLASRIIEKDKQFPCENLKLSSFFQERKYPCFVRQIFQKTPEVLQSEHQHLKDRVAAYLANHDRTGLLEIQKEIFCILEGTLLIEE